MYTLRKSTVEHPFGTMKRSLGFTYFLHRGLNAVRTEASLFAMAYNFKRLVNISNIKDIIRFCVNSFFYVGIFGPAVVCNSNIADSAFNQVNEQSPV